MAHRAFVDSQRIEWEVWEVVPETIERRMRDDRRADVRATADRREPPVTRYRLGSRPVTAWLCFESKLEKRRLAPVPEQWERLPPDALEALLHRADPAPLAARKPSTPVAR